MDKACEERDSSTKPLPLRDHAHYDVDFQWCTDAEYCAGELPSNPYPTAYERENF